MCAFVRKDTQEVFAKQVRVTIEDILLLQLYCNKSHGYCDVLL